MFEITARRDPFNFAGLHDLMACIGRDPFLRSFEIPAGKEGTLALDVSESDDELLVRASLPGFNKDDVDVQVHDGVLSIKAAYVQRTDTKDEKFYRKERRITSLSRRIALPGVVTESEAAAELKDGVLTVRIPRSEVARPTQISIN